jgi:diguanylate cyclase (GGDEF)-like protein
MLTIDRSAPTFLWTWLLLGLLLLLQLLSLFVAVGGTAPADPRLQALMTADLVAMLIGAALARSLWRIRTVVREHELRQPAPAGGAAKSRAEKPVATVARAHQPAAPTLASPHLRAGIPSGNGEPGSDLSSIEAMLQELTHKAQHDSLTGLPNRALALDRLQQAIQRAHRHNHSVAVMFIDLNGFKPLNDTYGHAFGDKVLRKTAERLKRSVREVDTVARLGGDEFLIIFEHFTESKAMDTAETLATIVQQPVAGKQGPVCVGMSTGIAMYPRHGTSALKLLRAADAAMYRSKRHKGRPMLADGDTSPATHGSSDGRFNDTTNLRMLDTWEGTLRGLRALSED